MTKKICQSCAMPIKDDSMLGTCADGSVSQDYCKFCYCDGEFLNKSSMEDYIEQMTKFAGQANMTPDEMREHCNKIFPTLKRWK